MFCLVIVLPAESLVCIVDTDFPGCPMLIFVEMETDEPGGKFARISFRIVNFPFSFEKKLFNGTFPMFDIAADKFGFLF
jgi:hypothetical protein